jgi:hypothetical protein
LRIADETLGVERPTSMTVESAPSSTRTTLQSQAILSTVLAEIGSENSISPAGAPAKPISVSIEAVT